MRAENGKYLTWFRRVGTDLPRATGKTESYGFGIFAPADAVKLDVASLPDTNPMVLDKGVVSPTAEQIATATSTGPSTSSATASGAPSSAPSTAPSAAGQAGPAAEPAGDPSDDESGSSPVWVVLAVLAVALLAGALVLLTRRRRSAAPDGLQTVPHTSSPHDTTAATDGVAATTKEHSHGGS